MSFIDDFSRRDFLRYLSVGAAAIPAGIYFPRTAHAKIEEKATIFRFPDDLSKLTDEQRNHLPKVTLPPVVEDGSQAPVIVSMDHPMDPDDYIRSIQILNFADPVVIKGKFYLTPANGEAYIGTQVRLNGGDSTVWVIVECSQHGSWAISKTVQVAAGGC